MLFPVISGQWASVPLGSTEGDGELTIAGTFCKNLSDSTLACDPSQQAAAWNLFVTQTSNSSLFANPPAAQFQRQKLFDEQTISAPQIVAPAIFPMGTVDKGLDDHGSCRAKGRYIRRLSKKKNAHDSSES